MTQLRVQGMQVYDDRQFLHHTEVEKYQVNRLDVLNLPKMWYFHLNMSC